MSTDPTGTVPETTPAGDGALTAEPTPSVAQPDGDRPTGETPSTEELARMAREAAPETVPVTAVDGTTTTRLADQTDLVYEHLGTFYADPDAAHDRLHALDADGRDALLKGDASVLGDLRADAPETGLRTDALVAHRDVYDLHPEEAERVTAARNDPDGTDLYGEIAPEQERPTRSSGLERGGPDDPAGDLEPPAQAGVQMPGLQESMEHRVIAHAMSPHQI